LEVSAFGGGLCENVKLREVQQFDGTRPKSRKNNNPSRYALPKCSDTDDPINYSLIVLIH